MQRSIGILAAVLASGVASSAEVPSADVVLAKMAGFSEASLTASNVALDVRLREASGANWRVEAPVLILADGAVNFRQFGTEKGYFTCTTTKQGDVTTITKTSARYFVGHRVEMSASECNSTSCQVVVTATIAIDGGVSTESKPDCGMHQTPNVIVNEARVDRRMNFDTPIRVDLGSEGELVVALNGLDYKNHPVK